MTRSRYYFAWGLVIVLGGVFLLPGCATLPDPTVSTGEQEFVLKDLCVRYNMDCSADSNSQVITLQRDYVQAKAMVGSATVIVQDEKVVLSSPVRLVRGVVYVPSDFKMKVMAPILQKGFMRKGAYKILIDPGHGGRDPGGIGVTGVKEKDVVLDISRRLKRSLEDKGFVVDMTRSSDVFLDLEERAQMANRKDVMLFISIHANIAKDRKVRGFEVYSLRDLDSKEQREAYDVQRYRQAFAAYHMRKSHDLLTKTLVDLLRNYKETHSGRLARHLSKEVSSSLDLQDRGEKQAGFHVLKYTLVPAVLVEVGFLSNPQEEKKMQSNSYRQQLADQLAESIARYARMYL